MKKHFKGLLTALLIAVCTVCLAVGLTACDKSGGGGDDGAPVKLAAPVLDKSGDILSWNAIEHADGYKVYENSRWIADTEETSYTITQENPGTYIYQVKAVTSDSNYSDSDMSNTKSHIVEEIKEQLATPNNFTISEDGVITWDAVPNASGYHLFEGEQQYNLTSNRFNISKKNYEGEYSYRVSAVSSNKKYTESQFTDTATFTVTQLPAPENVTFDEQTAVLSWDEVDNADGYRVYIDGSLVGEVTETSYEVMQEAGTSEFSVMATSTSVKYASESIKSEPEEFEVPLIASVSIVSFPESFSAENVTVALYNGEELVTSAQSQRGVDNSKDPNYSTVKLIAPVNSYTVKLQELPAGFVATWARVDADNRTVSVTVHESTGDNGLEEGEHSFEVTFAVVADQSTLTVEQEYIFTAGQSDDGFFSIIATGFENSEVGEGVVKAMSISVNGTVLIDTDATPKFLVNSFRAEKGEIIILAFEFTLTIEGTVAQSELTCPFDFEIVNHEIPQTLEVLSQPYNPDAWNEEFGNPEQAQEQTEKVNYITGSCTRYIELDEAQTLTFMFMFGTVGDRTITLKVGDKQYTLVGGGDVQIDFEAGETRVEITVTGSSYAGQNLISFYVYEYIAEDDE